MSYGSLPMGDRKGRMGANYVCAVVTQAALPAPEFKSGEDHIAVDLNVEFPASPVRVQVKCGTLKPTKQGWITVPLEASWREKWAKSKIPVYLVYVRLERDDPRDWIVHDTDLCTTIHAHAHWVRVDGLSAASAKVPLANRLSTDTFEVWHNDVRACFGEAV